MVIVVVEVGVIVAVVSAKLGRRAAVDGSGQSVVRAIAVKPKTP